MLHYAIELELSRYEENSYQAKFTENYAMKIGEKIKKNFPPDKLFKVNKTIPAIPKPMSRPLNYLMITLKLS